MTFIDYYKILGIEKKANAIYIKSAFRKLASKYHPDLNPNDADVKKNFQQINEANEALSDPEKRIGSMLNSLKMNPQTNSYCRWKEHKTNNP